VRASFFLLFSFPSLHGAAPCLAGFLSFQHSDQVWVRSSASLFRECPEAIELFLQKYDNAKKTGISEEWDFGLAMMNEGSMQDRVNAFSERRDEKHDYADHVPDCEAYRGRGGPNSKMNGPSSSLSDHQTTPPRR